jgi:hypothetical protein
VNERGVVQKKSNKSPLSPTQANLISPTISTTTPQPTTEQVQIIPQLDGANDTLMYNYVCSFTDDTGIEESYTMMINEEDYNRLSEEEKKKATLIVQHVDVPEENEQPVQLSQIVLENTPATPAPVLPTTNPVSDKYQVNLCGKAIPVPFDRRTLESFMDRNTWYGEIITILLATYISWLGMF